MLAPYSSGTDTRKDDIGQKLCLSMTLFEDLGKNAPAKSGRVGAWVIPDGGVKHGIGWARLRGNSPMINERSWFRLIWNARASCQASANHISCTEARQVSLNF